MSTGPHGEEVPQPARYELADALSALSAEEAYYSRHGPTSCFGLLLLMALGTLISAGALALGWGLVALATLLAFGTGVVFLLQREPTRADYQNYLQRRERLRALEQEHEEDLRAHRAAWDAWKADQSARGDEQLNAFLLELERSEGLCRLGEDRPLGLAPQPDPQRLTSHFMFATERLSDSKKTWLGQMEAELSAFNEELRPPESVVVAAVGRNSRGLVAVAATTSRIAILESGHRPRWLDRADLSSVASGTGQLGDHLSLNSDSGREKIWQLSPTGSADRIAHYVSLGLP